MNMKHIVPAFTAMILASLLAGCSKESTIGNKPHGQLSELELAMVNATQTKAAIDGTTFPQDGHLGLFLFKEDAAQTLYGDEGYANVDYSYNQTKNRWTANPSIKVGSTSGYLYGYYPYNSAVTDIKAVPVMSSLNGDDVMYASKQDGPITDANASMANITMNHALARVSITIRNNGYSGQAKLSAIKFAGACTSVSGTLNATDGTLSATTKADVTFAVPEAAGQITSAGSVYECLLVPSAEIGGRQNVSITFTIDGQEKTATLSGDNGVIIAQGVKSTIGIAVSNSGLSVQGVSVVDDWNVVEVLGHKVTVRYAEDAGIRKDVMLAAYAEGNSVKILAQSNAKKSLECVRSADDVCSASKSGDIYTFKVSDITSDLTLTVQYTRPHGISLSHTSRNLFRDYDHKMLKATVTPAEALNKDVVWSTSDPEIATVDENGLVYAHNKGRATITATTVLGGHAANCTIVVGDPAPLPDGALPGYFSVGEEKLVHFLRGNLYCKAGATAADDVWEAESKQYEYHTYDSVSNEWGLFGWSTPATNYGMNLSFYFNTYEGDFKEWGTAYCTAKGISPTNLWYTPSMQEWYYLKNHSPMKDVSVCGVKGVAVAPDRFQGTIQDSYGDLESWMAAENAGVLFLPYAGYRVGADLYSVQGVGYYYSSTPYMASTAYFLFASAKGMSYQSRANGMSVRLATTAK